MAEAAEKAAEHAHEHSNEWMKILTSVAVLAGMVLLTYAAMELLIRRQSILAARNDEEVPSDSGE